MMSRVSLILLVACALLFVMGVTMVFNTSAAEVIDRGLSSSTTQAMFRQILYAVVGSLGALAVWLVGYDHILRLSGYLLGGITFLLLLALIPGVGSQINGAYRWLSIGGYSFQPSEFAKFLIPVYYIHKITSYEQGVVLKDFLILLSKIALPIVLIFLEPDNGTVAIILASLCVLFILTNIRWTFWALPLLALSLVGGAVALQMPHVKTRIQIYLNPESDLQGKGHQPHQAKIAAGSGGLLGKGLGESMQKLTYLPEARSDYIAAIYAEEFGFIGMCGLIFLYMVIGYCGLLIALKTEDLSGFYLSAILTFLLCFPAFINLGVVSGLLPSKGTNLPFFSQGGSSLLSNFMMVFLMVQIDQRSWKCLKKG